MQRLEDIPLFLSAPHRCSYLPGRIAGTLVVDPRQALDSAGLSAWTGMGFRRSGNIVYRPFCPGCRACVPVRVPVDEFTPSRSQRRVLARNRDLQVHQVEPRVLDEHFALYRRYQSSRHRGGEMDDGNQGNCARFLFCPGVETEVFEHRLDGRLLAVAVADRLVDGLSAVYTFFEPDEARRSLGTFAVLREIADAARRRLPYLYLGYWIEGCLKMSYKNRFRPLEEWTGDTWTRLRAGSPRASAHDSDGAAD